jgi:hypothetical protein
VHLFPQGWLCIDHAPEQPTPDPELTIAGLATRELAVIYPKPCAYGAAR